MSAPLGRRSSDTNVSTYSYSGDYARPQREAGACHRLRRRLQHHAQAICLLLAAVAVAERIFAVSAHFEPVWTFMSFSGSTACVFAGSQASASASRTHLRRLLFGSLAFPPLCSGCVFFVRWRADGGADDLLRLVTALGYGAATLRIQATNRIWGVKEVDSVRLWRVMRRVILARCIAFAWGTVALYLLQTIAPEACRSLDTYVPRDLSLPAALSALLGTATAYAAATEGTRRRVLRLWQVPLSSLLPQDLSELAPLLELDRRRRQFSKAFVGGGSAVAGADATTPAGLRRTTATRAPLRRRGEGSLRDPLNTSF